MSHIGHIMSYKEDWDMKLRKTMKKKPKSSIREQFTEALDIPREVVIDLPVITIVGNREISIENFNRLIEYTNERIRLDTKSGVISMEGIDLEAKSMTAEIITIKGKIINIGFITL